MYGPTVLGWTESGMVRICLGHLKYRRIAKMMGYQAIIPSIYHWVWTNDVTLACTYKLLLVMEYYVFCERWKWCELWISVYGNKPVLLLARFSPKNETAILPHPTYSSDLTHLFPELSRWLQCRSFSNVEEAQTVSLESLKDIAKQSFQECFDEFYIRWQKCVCVTKLIF